MTSYVNPDDFILTMMDELKQKFTEESIDKNPQEHYFHYFHLSLKFDDLNIYLEKNMITANLMVFFLNYLQNEDWLKNM